LIPPDLFTTRELASAFWLTVFVGLVAALAIKKPDVRASLARLLGLRLPLGLLLILGLFAGWVAAAVGVIASVGLWSDGLTKDTLLWFAVPGLGLFVSLGEVGEQGFFRRRFFRTLGLSAILAFYLNVLTFNIAVEIAIQPLATALVIAATRAKAPERKRRAERLLALLGLALFAATTLNLIANGDPIDVGQQVLSWLLPIWLTAVALPFVYVLGLYDQYHVLFRLADMDAVGWRARFRARVALLKGLGFRASELMAVRPYLGTVRRVAIAPSLAAARAEIEDNRARRKAEAEAKRQQAEDLNRYAGVKGFNEEGRVRDRREFAETTRALQMLSSRQMGWYRNRGGRYQMGVLDTIPQSNSGLPAKHGIKMRVRRDGQAWFGWRRTPSGWALAIGAAGPPPDQQFYDGPTPPKGYPGASPGWAALPGPNWAVARRRR
jgi:hypothetical protein